MSFRRSRLPFLPVFFVTLGVVFVIAVVLRLRSYTPANANEDEGPATTTRRVTPPSGATTSEPVSQPPETYTLVPAEGTSAKGEGGLAGALNAIVRAVRPQAAATAPPIVQVPSATSSLSIPSRPQSKVALPSSHSAQMSSSSSDGGTAAGEPSSRPRTEAPKEAKDNTSDTTPPQLVGMDFNPSQIHDGEETMLTVNAIDDLSGVRVISGTIATPTGGMQGFALQREGDTTRYFSRIAVPKDAPEGLWRISYLSMSDNAGNTATLAANQGSLSVNGFRVVSSRSDTKPPTLRAIWLDRVSMRAGEKNTIFVQADDEGTGVNLISGVFQSPSKFARIGFGCRPGANSWQCDFAPPASADCGDWKLEQVQLQDKANNMTTVRTDNPLVAAIRVTMGGADCDSQPPEMQMITLDRNVVTNTDKSTINVRATVTDDISGVASISAQVTGPAGRQGTPRLYFSLVASGDPNTWTGQIIVPALAAKGQWEVAWVQILDKANNLRTYSRSDAVLRGAAFNVQ